MLAYGLICLGIILGQTYHFFTSLYLSIAIIFSAFSIFIALRHLRVSPTTFTNLISYILILIVSFSYSNTRQLYGQAKQLTEPISNLAIKAYIAAPIKTSNGYNQTTLQINQGKFAGQNISVIYPESYLIAAGYNYQLDIALKPIAASQNQDAFDYQQSMLNKDIIASGYILSKPILLNRNNSLTSQISALRIHIINNLAQKLATHKYAGFFIALVTGYQGLIPTEQWDTFRHTGINHIISISGLHLTIATTSFIILINLLMMKYIPPTRLPRQIILAWISVIFATAYALLAGFSIPTQRALYMVIISAYLLSNRHYIPILYKLLISLATVLLIDPVAIFSIGFWFSYLLVAAILIALATEIPKQHKFYYWLRLQIIITLAGIPLSLYYFSSVSISSMLANLWAIPVLGSIFTPSVFLVTILNNTFLIQLVAKLLDYALVPIEILAKIPMYWQTKPNLANILMSYLGLLLFMIPLPIRGKNLFAVLLIINILFANRDKYIIYGQADIHLFSHQRLGSALIETHQHKLLVINTNESSINLGAFNSSVLPYLQARQMRKIDYLLTNNPTQESEFINYLNNENIQISANLMIQQEIDGIDMELFRNGAKFALITKRNDTSNYIGNCMQIDKITKIKNMVITLPNANCDWLLSGSYDNLLINSDNKSTRQINSLLDNLNLSASNVYNLYQNSDVIITIK